MAQLITQDGTRQVKPENGKDFKLQELYKLLNCQMIQVIDLPKKQIMIFDEEGKCKDHYLNEAATTIAGDSIGSDDYIAGHALVCKQSELK